MGRSPFRCAVRRAPQAGPLIVLILVSVASAANLSLPLDGYYRTGKYMPVRFEAQSGELRISAEGAITTEIRNPSGGIAPFLIVRSPIRNSPFSQPLHELQANEKLVGYAMDAPGVAEQLFPDAKIIPIRLDPANPLPGFSAWWQTLDAVVLSDTQLHELQDWQALLAGGTTLIVNSSAPPASEWPWEKETGAWVVRAREPILALAGGETYGPISGWMPGRPAMLRRLVFAAGAIFTILLASISLIRSRWMLVVGVMYGALTAAVAMSIGRLEPDMASAMGRISVEGPFCTSDFWRFRRAMRSGDFSESYAGDGLILPMPPTNGDSENMTLAANPRGWPIEFRYRLNRDGAAAFVSVRAFSESAKPPATQSITSPLQYLLPSDYPRMAVLGQYPDAFSDDSGFSNFIQWPGLLLANSDAMPK